MDCNLEHHLEHHLDRDPGPNQQQTSSSNPLHCMRLKTKTSEAKKLFDKLSNKWEVDSVMKNQASFAHPDYSIGCGGFEEPMQIQGKTYLYVWNRVLKQHEYYVFEDDLFIADTDVPWALN